MFLLPDFVVTTSTCLDYANHLKEHLMKLHSDITSQV